MSLVSSTSSIYSTVSLPGSLSSFLSFNVQISFRLSPVRQIKKMVSKRNKMKRNRDFSPHRQVVTRQTSLCFSWYHFKRLPLQSVQIFDSNTPCGKGLLVFDSNGTRPTRETLQLIGAVCLKGRLLLLYGPVLSPEQVEHRNSQMLFGLWG